MKIHNFSRIIAFPFVIWFAVVLYITMETTNYDLSYWIIPPFVIIAIIFIMTPQIDYWWLERHPVPLDPEAKNWLNKFDPIYTGLSEENIKKYDNRMSLFLSGKEFIAMGKKQESVPEDIKLAISHLAIGMTLHRDEYLFKNLDRFVIYKHPFPSPKYQFLHTLETHAEDGVMVLSLEHLSAAIMDPKSYFHVGQLAFAEIFIKQNPTLEWAGISSMGWVEVEKITGFRKDQILSVLGFENYDELAVVLSCYFSHKEKFKALFPRASASLKEVFGY